MGDTFVKWFADVTNWVASVTVLPEQKGVRTMIQEMFGSFTAPGILGMADKGSKKKDNKMSPADHRQRTMIRLVERLEGHIAEEELKGETCGRCLGSRN